MEQQDMGKRFWRMIGPLFIYWIIQWAAQCFMETALYAVHWPEIIDMSKLIALSFTDQITYLSEEILKHPEIITDNLLLITTVAAIATMPLTLFYFTRDKKRNKKLGISQQEKPPVWKYAILFVLGAAACLGLNNILNMCAIAFFKGNLSSTLSNLYAANMGLQFIGMVIIVPISEELMYRGVLFNRYHEDSGYLRAAIYSSIIFALAHGSSLEMIYAGTLGMILSYGYEKFGSILAPIFIHIVVNATAVIGTKFGLFGWMLTKPIRAGIVIIVCTFFCSTAVVLLQGMKGREVAKKKEKTDN